MEADMTLSEFVDDLTALPAEAPVVFETPHGQIRGGYHVTEIKRHDIHAINCGAQVDRWTEASMQLLDGSAGEYLRNAKMARILSGSAKAIGGLKDAPLHVEFGHGNIGLHRYAPGRPTLTGEVVLVPLTQAHAVCKPAIALGHQDCRSPGQDAAPVTKRTRCCG